MERGGPSRNGHINGVPRPRKRQKTEASLSTTSHDSYDRLLLSVREKSSESNLPNSKDSNHQIQSKEILEQKPNGLSRDRSNGAAFDKSNNSPTQHQSLKAKAQSLLPHRKTLPIWSHAAEIRGHLRDHDVLLLVGETGSGKSTQVPQFLLSERWCQAKAVSIPASPANTDGKPKHTTDNPAVNAASGKPRNSDEPANISNKMRSDIKIGGCIAVTEPRRVAAISLARRVAEELGSPLGGSSPASTVGYSVRFEHAAGLNTRIKFLTEGMLLQEMLRDPWLRAYSAVVVDEVHERGVGVDLVLGFLKRLVAGRAEGRGGMGLKVVVMSATAEMERLGEFFEEGKGATNGNEGKIREDVQMKEADEHEEEWNGFSSSDEEPPKDSTAATIQNGPQNKRVQLPNGVHKEAESSPQNSKHTTNRLPLQKPTVSRVATCHISGRQYPVKINYLPEPTQDFVDSALRTIFQIHHKEALPGDVLVFVTGQDTVESLEASVKEYALGLGPDLPKMLVLPLFAALPQPAQQRVFVQTPPNTRKIIIATNIAETSVTIPGIRFVVDCGKAKIKQFRSRIGLESLLVKPISKSAAIQRKGRAGREAPGQCYRLYTEPDYLTLQESNTPEILRCDLARSILTMKARGIDDVLNFPFLDRPSRESLEKALIQLFQLGALKESGPISEIGLRMAKFPLSVPLGRVLIAASQGEIDCTPEVIDIISCFSVENVFLNTASVEQKEEAESARRELIKREGEHLTYLATVQAYTQENSDRKAWAAQHHVLHRAMQAVMDVRKQLQAQCQQIGLLEPTRAANTPSPDLPRVILKAFLKGFAMNTARLCPDGSYKTLIGNQTVAIHPSSCLFGRKVEAIMYNEFVFTNRSYARGVSAVQMDWVGEAMGV